MTLIALIRPPTAALDAGERTHVERTPIDFARAQEQHANYACALSDAGAQIVVLPPLEHLPDAAFIEDTALVLDCVAVIAHSGAASRRAETASVASVLSRYCYLTTLPEGATFDGGDALVIDRTVYIGHSQRTNLAAITFLTTLLRQNAYDVVLVPVSGCLHLKTAVTYLGNNTVLMNPTWVHQKAFYKHDQIMVDTDEPMAANTLLVRNRVLMSIGCPVTLEHVTNRGFQPHVVDLSEFHKAEGGPTCLSILIDTPHAQ